MSRYKYSRGFYITGPTLSQNNVFGEFFDSWDSFEEERSRIGLELRQKLMSPVARGDYTYGYGNGNEGYAEDGENAEMDDVNGSRGRDKATTERRLGEHLFEPKGSRGRCFEGWVGYPKTKKRQSRNTRLHAVFGNAPLEPSIGEQAWGKKLGTRQNPEKADDHEDGNGPEIDQKNFEHNGRNS